jgi:2Fe-2S ferredoxin
MVEVTFVLPNGQSRTVAAAAGQSVMQVAVDENIVGIQGDCGGNMSCGTCHVYVDEAWAAQLPAPGEVESAVLDGLIGQRANSRLSCQIKLSAALSGLKVTVAGS